MTTNSAQVLSVMLRQLTGVHMAANKLTGVLNKAAIAAAGIGSVFVGGAILKGLSDMTKKAIDFNQQLVQMKMAGYSDADISKMRAQALKTMTDVPGSGLTDNIKALADIRTISGSADHAVALSEMMAKTNLVLSNITGKPAEDAGYKFMKFLEDSGRTIDPKTGQFSEQRVEQQSVWMRGVLAAMNGRVTGDQLFQLRQSGKSSINALSDVGLTNLLPSIQALGPVSVGTAIQGGQQQLLGSVQLRKHTIEWLEGLGMMDPNKVHKAKGGMFTLDRGALKGEDQFMTDRAGWTWDVLEKAMAAKGMDRTQMVQEIGRSGLRTPMLGLLADLIQNEVTHKKEIGNVATAGKVDQFDVMDKSSPTFAITKLTEAWENFQKVMGGPGVDFMIVVFDKLTRALNFLTGVLVAHPTFATDLFYFVGAFGAFLALGGTLVVMSIALGPFVTGIRLFGSALLFLPTGAIIGGIATGIRALGAALGMAGFATAGGVANGVQAIGAALGSSGFAAAAGIAASLVTLGAALITLKGDTAPLSSDDKKKLDERNKQELDQYQKDHPNWHPAAFQASPSKSPMVQVHAAVNIDGRKVADMISQHQAYAMNLPGNGATRFDSRMSPSYTNDVIRA